MGTVEVETAESVNNLEAMAQWAHLGRARAPFHLYVPAGSVDIARRLATDNNVNVAEIWSYHTIGDQTRFTMVHRAPVPEPRRAAAAPAASRTPSKAAKSAAARPPARAAATRKPARPAARSSEVPPRENRQRGPRRGSNPCRTSGSAATSAATSTHSSSTRNGGGAGRARGYSIGSAPRQASGSAAPRWTKTPSA